MKDWKEYKLGDVAEIIGGGTPKTSVTEYWGGDIPWLTPKDLTNYRKVLIDSGERFITREGFKKSSTKMLPKNAVLFTSRAPIGYIAIANREMCTNQGFKSLIPDYEILSSFFLYYWLKSNIAYLKSIGTGTTFAEISGTVLKGVDILLPPLKEQQAIAKVLSELDNKIELLHQQNQTLESLAETLFRQWFIEDPNEDWQEKMLGDLVEVKIGRTPPRKEFHWFTDTNCKESCKWISIKDLGSSGVYVFDTAEYIVNEAISKFRIPVIPKNTVLLSFKMTVGRVAITTESMLSNEAIAHFLFHSSTPFTIEYLYFFLKTYQFDTLGTTSSIVTAINSEIIRNISVLIPPKDYLKTFSFYSKPLFEKIYSNQSQIRTLEALRDSLLPKLISGEIRLPLA